ncbi:choice-of-anchor V domain-containing protein [Polaribacter dokdonensis]|jgi:hypothetical protein|uniref:Por secretion system C-terminal sorting domain-containing protein n=1 Tax=Polaribacter dokdonensis DSW-5 TaxID=1300348 RepID=A0A0N0UP07_9FLAO|nr:choice-of-anchor V domain-containing protein [Polaribacter dokdonensis]KOY53060.1 Reeler region domain protein [Polaribacter dokdonensis DSW-5]SEE56637.1 Por secretion system C-terminal sorting domain-containing protein [Polaribacter dokdonensis DSW-5]
MNKNYFFKFILLAIPVSAFLLMSSSGGRNDARSGSPGDNGASCVTCHPGPVTNASAEITSDIPDTGYLLDTDYTININTTSSSSSVGFQLTAENSSNTKIGSFTAGSGSRTINSDKSITHSTPSASGDWSFTWRSPSTDLGRVTFYSAVNASAGEGSFGGNDQVVLVNASSASLSISEAQKIDFAMYPNPASDILNIDLPIISEKVTVEFYDQIGKLAYSQNLSTNSKTVNVKDLATGIYIIKVIADGKIGTQKFIKR